MSSARSFRRVGHRAVFEPGLLPQREEHGRDAVEERRGVLVCSPSTTTPTSFTRMGWARLLAHHHVADLPGVC